MISLLKRHFDNLRWLLSGAALSELEAVEVKAKLMVTCLLRRP